jgi:DNA-binding transcriptional MerR regulator
MHVRAMEDDFFTSRELKVLLTRHRGKAVPDRTLRFWRNELEIRPANGYLYDRNDLQLLVRLIRWIARGGTIRGFRILLSAEYQEQQSARTEQTINA